MKKRNNYRTISLGKCTRISPSAVVYEVKLGEAFSKKYEKVKDDALTDSTKCSFHGGILSGKILTVGEIRFRGLEIGRVADRSREREEGVMLCHARVFDNAPLLNGYGSPSWGGEEIPLWYESLNCE